MLKPLILSLCVGLGSISATTLAQQAEPPAKVKLYGESANAKAPIAAALADAKKTHRRVLLQWGGNWCGWCIRLHELMAADESIARTLRGSYVVVHLDAGKPAGKNIDLAEQYKADVKKGGFPYLTVLDADGAVLANQETGALEIGTLAQGHDPKKVLGFLARHAAKGEGVVLTPAARLKDARARYAAAKTYRDTGMVETRILADGQKVVDRKPFSTVFERDGRFLWEFRSSPMPGGKPTMKYVVWSSDQMTFRSWWDLSRKETAFASFDFAMAGPTGVSGGSATAIIPLLRKAGFGASMAVVDPSEVGVETIDGVECTIITGKRAFAGDVKLWLDGDGAIRKIVHVQEIDPAKLPQPKGAPKVEKVMSETTITITPVFDQPIDTKDFEFTPPIGKGE